MKPQPNDWFDAAVLGAKGSRVKRHESKTGFIMEITILAAFSLTGYFMDAWGEFTRYFGTMNQTQWAVVSACAVAFGFLCLKGSNANR